MVMIPKYWYLSLFKVVDCSQLYKKQRRRNKQAIHNSFRFFYLTCIHAFILCCYLWDRKQLHDKTLHVGSFSFQKKGCERQNWKLIIFKTKELIDNWHWTWKRKWFPTRQGVLCTFLCILLCYAEDNDTQGCHKGVQQCQFPRISKPIHNISNLSTQISLISIQSHGKIPKGGVEINQTRDFLCAKNHLFYSCSYYE